MQAGEEAGRTKLEKIIAIIFQENLISLTGAECMSLKI